MVGHGPVKVSIKGLQIPIALWALHGHPDPPLLLWAFQVDRQPLLVLDQLTVVKNHNVCLRQPGLIIHHDTIGYPELVFAEVTI